MRAALLAAALAATCARASTPAPAPAPAPTIAALSALRNALDRGDLARAVDPEALARAELLERMARLHDMQEHTPVGVTEEGWRRALDDVRAGYGPAGLRREFERARPLLGDGRCAEVAPSPLPDALSPVASARPTWPAFVEQDVRAPLARRAVGARAGEFRCEGGGASFRAVFVPRDPPDGTLVVARITPR